MPNGGTFADAIKALVSNEFSSKCIKRAIADVESAIEAIKNAPDNIYGNNDEDICKAIIDKLEQQKNDNCRMQQIDFTIHN